MERIKLKKISKKAEVVEELSYKPHQTKPWVVLFQLPTEPVWYIALFILSYLAILEALFSSVNNKCVDMKYKQILLVPDIAYIVDLVLTALVHFVKRLNLVTLNVPKLPLLIVIFDIYSLIPQEYLYSGDESHYCLMRVNRVTRCFRLFYMIYKSHNSLNRHVLMHVVDFALTFSLLGFINYCVYCNIVCSAAKCVGTACDADAFFVGIVCAMENIVERKIEDEVVHKLVWSFFMLGVVVMSFLFRAFISVHMIHRATHQHTYMYRYKIMKHRHEIFNVPEYIKEGAEKAYKLFWQQCKGYRHSKHCLAILSPVMSSEILIDISWPAFKHSKLFRGMGLPFLREVATYMRQVSYLPDEVIYRKAQLKKEMMYVVSGTISVLSDEDGESPIISFTSGTVIGEMSLFISTKSTNFLQCKTFCHLHVLEQKDFVSISLKYPAEYRALKRLIQERLNYAKESNEIVLKIKQNFTGIRRGTDVYTIFWLKNILHALMSTNAEAAYRHDFQNVHLMREYKRGNLKHLLFCANNLDMLAITERIEKTQDSNFARLKFPYILHSTSVILKLWEIFIVGWTLLFSFMVPYIIFVSTYLPVWYKPLITFGTFVFAIDIYIQISTTVTTSSGVLCNIKAISVYRFKKIGFWMDLVSCLPMEVFNPIVIDNLSSNSVASMHLNRVLKIWRIQRLFEAWSHSSTANHVYITFLKYTWILSYVTFTIFMYLRYENPDDDLLNIIFISCQWARTLDYSAEGFRKNEIIKPIIDEYVLLILLAFYGSVAFIHVLRHSQFIKIQQTGFGLLTVVKKANVKLFSQRVIDYLLGQYQADYCYYLHQQSMKRVYLSRTMLLETVDAIYGDEVRTLPLFKCFNKNFSFDACSIMRIFIFAPKEVIAYYGCVTSYCYIMVKGHCEMFDERAEVVKCLTGVKCFNFLEVLLQTPMAHTFRAITHCMVLRFDRKKLLRKLFRYEADYRFYKSFIRSCTDIQAPLMELCSRRPVALKPDSQKQHSFVTFPVIMEKDSPEEYDFYIPYDRLYPFGFIRYFFWRSTMIPDGMFLYYLKWIKTCVVLITGICYFVPVIIIDYPWILHVLDIIGLAFIYMRLHICYYNEDGVLITHPLETAKNYWRTAFMYDFFSVIPFRYLLSLEHDWTLVFLNSNHLLQLRSFLQMMNYIKTDIVKPRSKWFSLFYIPFMLVLCNVFGMMLFTIECTISRDSSEDNGVYIGYTCVEDSILASSPFSKPITLARAHLYYVYTTTTLITNISFQGPVIRSDVAIVTFMVGLLVGLYISVEIMSYVQEFHCFRQGYLLENQIAMRHLKKFLDVTIRDSKLKKVVIRTCELKWLRLKGQGLFQLVKPFTLALKSDILYEFYGKNLHEHSPFKTNTSQFYKNVLPLLKFDLIVKGGFLQTINDVDDNIYILYQGMADVLAPDGTTFQTLQAGSIYGNITDGDRSRLKLSIVAMTHVEVLLCKTSTFLQLLRYYPQSFEEFKALRRRYMYYIPTQTGIVRLTEGTTSQNTRNLFTRALEPNSHFVRIWNFLYLIFACYLGIILDVYQMGSADFSYTVLTIQYICDLMYLTHFLLQDRVAYENEWGYMVYDLNKIKQKRRENKVMLVVTIIAMLPVDVVIYSLNVAVYNRTGFNGLYRINRVLRIAYLAEYVRVQSKKLDVRIFVMKLMSLCMWAILTVNVFASLVAMFSCSLTPNLSPAIPSWEDKEKWNSSALIRLHLTFIYTSWSAFCLSAQNRYVPEGSTLIALFIFTMIAGYYCYTLACCETLSIVNEFYIKKGQYLKLYHHIKYFLFTENVSAALRQKCLNICSILWMKKEGEMFPRLLDEVSPYLKDTTMNCAFTFYVGGHPVFEKCHKDFVRQVVQKVKYRVYYAGEYVQFKGAIDRTMYFVFDGEVHELVDEYMHSDEIVQILNKGNSFGVKQGLNKMMPHEYSYRCERNTIILTLSLQDWEYLLTYFPASKKILFKDIEKDHS